MAAPMLLRYRQAFVKFNKNIEIFSVKSSNKSTYKSIVSAATSGVLGNSFKCSVSSFCENISVRLYSCKSISSSERIPNDKNIVRNLKEGLGFILTSRGISDGTARVPKPQPQAAMASSNDSILNLTSTDINSQRRTSFTERTHMCGELSISDVGNRVILTGWIQNLRMSGQFVILRDAIGSVQIVIPRSKSTLLERLAAIPLESVIRVEGLIRQRPEGQANRNMATGDVEVVAEDVNILNECMPSLPFQVHDHHTVKESLRLRYRYLEMRGRQLQADLRFRSQLIQRMRRFLIQRHAFVDVETPTLFRRTPGGAREFIVPTKCEARVGMEGKARQENKSGLEGGQEERIKEEVKEDEGKGLFYSLPQSPQQFKQLLMVGAIDRYMQIARCYRDETSKPDRQPEFTQLDIEMSFITQPQIMSLIEQLLAHCWPVIGSDKSVDRTTASVNQDNIAFDPSKKSGIVRTSENVNKTVAYDWMKEEEEEFIFQGSRLNLPPLKIPFLRMNYEDALKYYGTDKPDTRFESKLVDATQVLRGCSFEPLSSSQSVQVVVFPADEVAALSRSDLEDIGRTVRTFSKKNGSTAVKFVAVCKVKSDGGWTGGLKKHLGESAISELTRLLQLSPGQVFGVVAGEKVQACLTAGRFRTETRAKTHPGDITDLTTPRQMNFLWVENFPLFLPSELEHSACDRGPQWESAHHPFTAAHPEDEHLLKTDPGRVRSQHYDLVLNGAEVGGGSIRIHDAELQKYVLREILHEDDAQLCHLLTALNSGCPPHGGIALGLDRLIAQLCGRDTVRDVIAFPKASDGKCLMSGAPAPVSKVDLEYYGIKVGK